MRPQLTPELRAGLPTLDNLPGIVVLAGPEWHDASQRWAVPCRIAAAVPAAGPIPPLTDWYVTADAGYPDGRIGIYPAKIGGITQTFPHQNYNGSGAAELPWRTGKLCTWTTVAPLHRRGYDAEPGAPETNLAWHLQRAQTWLELASQHELAMPGDPYELPDLPHRPAPLIAFCESPSNLRQWQDTPAQRGTADLDLLDNPSETRIVTRCHAGSRLPSIEQAWRRPIGIDRAKPAIWLKMNHAPVLPPWQIPTTWGELRQACALQGIALDHTLQYSVSNRAGADTILLLGFPIPDLIGGPNLRMHWLALTLPAIDRTPQPGFRNNQQGQWLAYQQKAVHDAAPINWLRTENWHYDEISVRGRLDNATAQQRILIIGAGAIGSVLAEMLARAGARDIAIIDSDPVEAGNLVRHTLLADDIGQHKASALSERLEVAAIHSQVVGIDRDFLPQDSEHSDTIRSCNVIIDTTGDDAVAAAMGRFAWGGAKTFISLSLGIYANRLFCYTARGSAFPVNAFRDRLQPWLSLESSEYDLNDLPRDGPGCWHQRHPARIDDVWMLTAAAVKPVERAIISPPASPALVVLERQVNAAGDFTGIRTIRNETAG